ncbi:MAG TPA: hypothetical protein VK436_01525 [Methanocella sp.]|nr:hypothetical protein [Methanocella sp.]
MVSENTPLVYDLQELYRRLIDLSVIEILEEKKLKKIRFHSYRELQPTVKRTYS